MPYQEHVWRPSRRIKGKRIQSRLYVGQFFIDGMSTPKRVSLDTPDKAVALERLRKHIVEKQRESEGLDSPKSQKVAAGRSIKQHLEDYHAFLVSGEITAGHVKRTTRRIGRILTETGWLTLADVTPDSFVRWLSQLKGAAKTRKEYQVSLNALLNWLVDVERLAKNRLSKLPMIEIRGKQVRASRAFSEEELAKLYAVSDRRAFFYQFLVHTGMRKEEAHSMLWGDLHLDEAEPFVVLRAETTKDKEERKAWLVPELATRLRAIRAVAAKAGGRVFPTIPHYETLRKDLERAGIKHRDASDRVVHFHAFRKTFNTLGRNHGMDLEARQRTLGHASPQMTANVYTDHSAVSSYKEAAKIPWIEAKQDVHLDAHKSGASGHLESQPDKQPPVELLKKAAGAEELSHAPSQPVTKGHWWWKLESNQRTS